MGVDGRKWTRAELEESLASLLAAAGRSGAQFAVIKLEALDSRGCNWRVEFANPADQDTARQWLKAFQEWGCLV